jgi:tetratricopeptide (TPR) repeat protein
MQPIDWSRVRSLFDQAVELPAADRDAFLRGACDDADVAAEVRALLDAAAGTGPLDDIGSRLASLRDVLAETPPRRAGPYVVDAPIGRGGMGVVYRAHDPRLERAVALKFLPVSMPTGSTDAERLTAEARTASSLDHPNICTIYDIGTADDGRIFIAMAYYARGTVEDRLRNGPLPVRDAVSIAIQLADALDTAHAAGIVHRDIKPANIAFGERSEVKVLDFGVAVLGADVGGVGTAGTPSYMSPEQAAGAAVDARSDVWGIGVLLYEMLTGRLPFAGGTREEILHRIRTDDPPAIETLRADVPAPLAAIVGRALTRNVDERIPSAAALRDALSRIPLGVDVRRTRRRRMAAAAAIILLLSSVAATVVLREDVRPRPLPGMSGDSALDEQFTRARQRYYEGSPEGLEAAAVILRGVLDVDSSHALARAFLANTYATMTRPSYSRMGQKMWLDSAVAHANAAIALAPDIPDGHAALGVAYRWLGRMDDALLQHQRALSRDPQYALSMLEMGSVYNFKRDRALAVRWLERGLALDPGVQGVRQYLAQTYRTFGMLEEARRHIAAGRRYAPDDASLIWESVLTEVQGGDTAVARADFEQYLQLVPPGERDRMIAWFEILRLDEHAAIEYIERLDLERSPWYDLRAFGTAYVIVGRREEGAEMLRRAAVGLDGERDLPDYARGGPWFVHGHMLATVGDTAGALDMLERWIESGGVRDWSFLALERGWDAIRDHPRFLEVRRISDERFRQDRAVIAAELQRWRDG